MLRKALSLKRFPYKSGCACSEKWGRPSTFALLFTRLGGHAPKSWTAAGLARAFFIRFYRFLGGYTPKKHWIFSRETGWSCSEFCTLSACLHNTSESCSFVKSISLRFFCICCLTFTNLKKSVDFLFISAQTHFLKQYHLWPQALAEEREVQTARAEQWRHAQRTSQKKQICPHPNTRQMERTAERTNEHPVSTLSYSFFPKKPMINVERIPPYENGVIQLSLFLVIIHRTHVKYVLRRSSCSISSVLNLTAHL